MATAQQTPVKPSAVPQYESFVEQQLAHARRRLLGFDAAAWALLLGCVVLAYGLSMSLADLLWDLPTSVRVVCWGVFMAALIVGAVVAARRLLSSVNPHFLARQLEHTVPDAKNSIINWLDLRAEPLAPVIRGSLGRRAAKDLSHADTERAISGKSLWWLGGIAGCLLLVQLGWLIAAPGQAWSLLQRAFFPFDGSRIALRTTLTLLKPEGGNVAVPPNQPVVFRVQADGFVPPLNHKDALKLHFGYHRNEPFEERPLLCDADGVWTTTVHADQVRGGFWYKITGGDAQLPEVGEYRVDVHAAPQVLRFEAAFKYRDYLKTKDNKIVFDKNVRPSIKEMRGTEVTLTVRTNRTLQQCVMELKQGGVKLDLAGEPVPGDPEAWRFKWLLDQSGDFRILFKSKEGEENVDRQASKIEVIPDLAPEVVMTKPAQDLSLPANGTLVVDGYATDDFGVKSMQLRLKLLKLPPLPAAGEKGRGEGMPELNAKKYRPDISFQLVNGKYPLKLDYSDFIALDKVQTATGEPFPLAAGMELEYWIEARDNCDYPSKVGNLGQSIRYKLTITPSETDKKKAEQDRQAAENGVGQKQGQQDKDMKDKNDQAAAENAAKGGAGSQGGTSQEKEDLKSQADAVQKAMNSVDNKGETKPGDQPNGEAKEKGPQDGSGGDAKGGEPQQKEGAGDSKEPGDQSKDNQAGASKGNKGGPGDQPKSAAGDGKGAGDAAAGQPPPGEKKDGKGDAAKSSPKGGPDNDAAAKGKGSPDADPKMDLGQQKGAGEPDPKNLASAPPGQTKGTELADNAGPKKGPGTVEQAAKAKAGDPTDKPPPAEATPGPPDPSQASSGKAGDRKDSKLEDVAKLRDQLEDPGQRDAAKNALEKIADQAADPKVQSEAQKLLDKAQANPGQAKAGGPQGTPPPITADAKTPGDQQKAGDPGKAVGKNAQDKAEAGATKEASGQSNKAGTAKNDPTKPGSSTGTAAQNTANHDNAGSPNPVDEAAARRAADLQLESLKKQIDKLREKFTPDVMKKLDWTPKEREDFLQKMLADALLRQQQQKTTGDKLPMPGSIQSPLPGSGPQLLQNLGGGGGPVIFENPEPPPGVREAMKAFQNKK